MIVGEDEIEEAKMERQLITGIAHDKNEAKVTLTAVPDRPARSRRSSRRWPKPASTST